MPVVYLVRCADGSYYTGWTIDLEKRVQAHNEGRGARYTRSRRPVVLVYQESVESKSEALKREYHIRRMSHEEKHALSIKKNG
mgnify:CR=1 FL=1